MLYVGEPGSEQFTLAGATGFPRSFDFKGFDQSDDLAKTWPIADVIRTHELRIATRQRSLSRRPVGQKGRMIAADVRLDSPQQQTEEQILPGLALTQTRVRRRCKRPGIICRRQHIREGVTRGRHRRRGDQPLWVEDLDWAAHRLRGCLQKRSW